MQTYTFKVHGMTCGGCVNTVTKAVQNVEAVTDVNITLQTGEVVVQCAQEASNEMQMRSAIEKSIEEAGYQVISNQTAAEHSPSPKGGCCGG